MLCAINRSTQLFQNTMCFVLPLFCKCWLVRNTCFLENRYSKSVICALSVSQQFLISSDPFSLQPWCFFWWQIWLFVIKIVVLKEFSDKIYQKHRDPMYLVLCGTVFRLFFFLIFFIFCLSFLYIYFFIIPVINLFAY